MTGLATATARLFERLRPVGAEDVAADIVVAPGTIAETAEVIAHAADNGMQVGFVGGSTHSAIGHPTAADIAIVSWRLTRVVDYQPADLTVVVEGGLPVADLDELLAEHELTAVLPERPGRATVGGTVAAAASAFRRLRYGPTRDRVLQVTMATGYGRVVTAGGRVVKNSTGYDLSRLAVGSLGSLGMIGAVCLKLWPKPLRTATVTVDDPGAAGGSVYRPLAVLETPAASTVCLAGTEEEIQAAAGALGGIAEPGIVWPAPVEGGIVLSLRVPPRNLGDGVARVRALGEVPFVAQHGVGVVEFAVQPGAVPDVLAARDWAEAIGGSLVVVGGSTPLSPDLDPWGTPPPSLAIQQRVKAAFDPAGILNRGKLPGPL